MGRPVSQEASALKTALPSARVADWSFDERAPITMSCTPTPATRRGHVLRVVLAVRVHEKDDVALRLADARLHRRPVPLVVGMAHDARPRLRGALGGEVGGAVVHDEDLAPRSASAHAADHVRDRLLLVEGGDDDGRLRGLSHGGRSRSSSPLRTR